MSDAEIRAKMKSVVFWWSLTQLLGSFGMPLWLAVVATQWYTYRNMLPGHVALVITFSKCIDVLTDPMMAFYLRKCDMHKIARIAAFGAFIQSVFFALMFVPFMPIDPWGGETRVLLQYAVCYTLFFVGDTFMGTPTTTLGTMLKSQRILDGEHHEQGLRLGSMAKVAGILVMGVCTYVVTRIFRAHDVEYGAAEGVSRDLSPNSNFVIAIFFGAAHWFVNFIFSVVVRDFDNSRVSAEIRADRRTFLEGFSDMITSGYNNPFFRQLIGAWVCDQLTITLVKNLLMWFVRHNVEPELGSGCVAYEDPANQAYVQEGGFEVSIPKSKFECSADSIVKGGVFFVILGAMLGNVFWQKKLDRERDEYGNGNVYRNWLLFNLSSALTNGLMVFVGRGDSRLFWILCFVNGLPFGGEFLTDTILLYLIGSETWLNRSESPMSNDEYSAQFDAHTTKFSMMKTFIPKVVSLVAEAVPLALIQIWYRDPNSRCEDENGNFIGVQACEEMLLYRIPGSSDDGTPRYIPQAPQVRELIAFFFYILPTVTTLTSYFLKSRFQVTDTASKTFTESLKCGAPVDPASLDRYGGSLRRQMQGQSSVAGHTKIFSLVTDFHKKLQRASARDRPLVTAENLDSFVTALQEATGGEHEQVDLSDLSTSLAFTKPRPMRDAWVGCMIPTTGGHHLFKLPICSRDGFTSVPANVLQFACQPKAAGWVLPNGLCHEPWDDASLSRAKAVLHGFGGPVLYPLGAVGKAAASACASLVQRVRPAKEDPTPAVGGRLSLFGVVGQRSVRHFIDRVLPELARMMLREVPRWRGDEHGIDAFIRHAVALCHGTALPPLPPDAAARLSRFANSSPRRSLVPPGVYHVSEPGGFALMHRVRCRLVYLQTLGASTSACMALVIIGMVVYWGTLSAGAQRRAWKWSVLVTVPLFVMSLGFVVSLYFTGLLRSKRGTDSEQAVGLADLFSLSAIHYAGNAASGAPLVFHQSGPPGPLDYLTVQPSEGNDRSISYVCLLPRRRQRSVMSELQIGHRLLDAVARECADAVAEDGGVGAVCPTWQVTEIAPDSTSYPYRCLLYCWWGVQPPGR
eukprot:TRINITY_DN32740_c0_g1_i1.p1 TRINITY_DN32740_c0_g1~~TRINITY_DN32740_c0_g1_i1.p1  ORF type:complete len:1149 (+),score=341.91 TRINITY_DN32740_c0_g1_i1:207-3449(+)